MYSWTKEEQEILEGMISRRPDLAVCIPSMGQFHEALVRCYDSNGTFYTCGNGGSCADAMHIVGELCKSFERRRILSPDFVDRLAGLPHGEALAAHLEAGLPAVTLGLNSALKTAIENDCSLPNIAFAQEMNALMRPGDLLLALSTSGNAVNCVMAMSVAKARGGITAALTGPKGGRMATLADVAMHVPGDSTKVIQEAHAVVWHTLCCLIEAHYFVELR